MKKIIRNLKKKICLVNLKKENFLVNLVLIKKKL